nr:MAG TPA: hypothetical protein [Bacteriophage sp.]
MARILNTRGAQVAPFLACCGLVGSIPAASIKHIFICFSLCTLKN